MPYFTTQDGCRIYYETQGFDQHAPYRSSTLPGNEALPHGRVPALQAGEIQSLKPVVVFLNGTMQTTVYWKTHALALKDRFRVLVYDARAQGQSDLGEVKLSLEGHAENLAELLKHLGVEKVNLVGMSHGAKVALAYAANFPECVARLVLCSVGAKHSCRARLCVMSWLEILKSSGLETLAWALLPVVFGENFLQQKEGTLDSIVKGIVKRNSKEALIAQLEAMTAYPPLSKIVRNVHIPSLVISSSDDPLVAEEGARELALLCNGQHKHLNGIGHSIPAEAPEVFNKTILQFLCSDA